MMQKAKSPGLLFVLPLLLALAALVLYPLLDTVYLSFVNQGGRFVGLQNYERILDARQTGRAFWNTLVYVGASVVLQLVIGTAVGILINQKFRARTVVRSVVLIPWVIPGIVAATTWSWMFHTEFGIINYMLTSTGIISQPIGWLTNTHTVMPALVAVNTWKMFPFVAVMVLAGLQSVPQSMYEAARVDGATFRDEVVHIMLPQLRPVLTSVSLLLLIWGLNSITIIYPMTGGGPANRSLITPIQIYKEAFEFLRFNQSAALSLVFFVGICVLIVLYIRATAERED